MSESDEGADERNLAREYADRYGGPDHDFSLPTEESPADRPGPAPPSPPSPPSGAEADPEITGLFWRLVLVFNVAIAALALGPMLVYFRGAWDQGLQITFLGAVTFAYGVVRYYRFRATQDDGGEQNG